MTLTWKNEAEALLRGIAPDPQDLGERPVYLVTEKELTASTDPNCYGCTSGVFDLKLRRRLEGAGRWAGRGFACLVCEQRIFGEFAGQADRIARFLRNVVLHEFAHWITWSAMHVGPTVNWPGGDVFDYGARFADAGEQPAFQPVPATKPWDGHGADFIRAACHVADRARESGCRVWVGDLDVADHYYGLSPVFLYSISLADELDRRRHEPLRQILASPPPTAFQDLFDADVLASQQRTNDAQERNVAA